MMPAIPFSFTESLMSEHSAWVAFRASDNLHSSTDGFIQRMRSGSSRTEPETIDHIMSQFMREVLHNFFILPSEQSGLSSGKMKVVHFATETISKAAHLVIKSTARKLNIEQNRRAAEYMDTVRFSLTINNEEVWFVAFPISDEMAARGRAAIARGMAGEGQQVLPALLQYFHELTDIALRSYFEEPMKLLEFGPILRKVANVGVNTTRKATHSVIDNIIPGMTNEQLAVACKFADMQLVNGPKVDT